MNILELKKAIAFEIEYLNNYKKKEDADGIHINFLETLLSACQLLCDTSDKMLPKMLIDTYVEFGCEPLYDAYAKEKGYNLAREEDILWITKKMMGIESLIKEIGAPQGLPLSLSQELATAIIQSFGQEKGE